MGQFDIQHSVLSVRQARTFMTDGEIRAKVASGQWQRPFRRVLVTHNGVLTTAQRRWAGLLAAPVGSALAGPTAAELEGLRGFERDDVWLAVPARYQPPRLGDTVILRPDELDPLDVHPAREPRRTTLERAVLDMASRATSASTVRVPVLGAVQQRLTIPVRLRDTLSRMSRCPHAALIAETIDDAEGGVHSLPEHEFACIVCDYGLPPPTRQRAVRRPGGVYYLDADWDPLPVSAEIHGAQHLEARNWSSDLDRCNELTIAGRRILQFSSYAVRHMPDRVGDQLARALRAAQPRAA